MRYEWKYARPSGGALADRHLHLVRSIDDGKTFSSLCGRAGAVEFWGESSEGMVSVSLVDHDHESTFVVTQAMCPHCIVAALNELQLASILF